MTKTNFLITAFIFAVFAIANPLKSQNMSLQQADFELKGSANVGSWKCDLNEAEGKINITSKDDGYGIESLEISLPVESFKCDEGSRMENNMYGYLESDDHPYITYKLNRVHPRTINDQGSVMFYGEITVAGETKSVRTDVKIDRGGTVTLSGSQELKMTDFDIDPPTAMLGTVRSRDKVEINFEISFE